MATGVAVGGKDVFLGYSQRFNFRPRVRLAPTSGINILRLQRPQYLEVGIILYLVFESTYPTMKIAVGNGLL